MIKAILVSTTCLSVNSYKDLIIKFMYRHIYIGAYIFVQACNLNKGFIDRLSIYVTHH